VTILAETGIAKTGFAAPQHANICKSLALDRSRIKRQLRVEI